MATMYVTEYADFPHMPNAIVMANEPGTDQVVTYTGTAGSSTAFLNNTRYVRVHVDGIASIKFGTAPTAVANTNKRLTAGQTEYYSVPMGQAYKVSAVTST